MNISEVGGILAVRGIPELTAANAHGVRDEIRACLQPHLQAIEIDLSGTACVDSCGLGALISLQKAAGRLNGGVAVRLLNPAPSVQQLFELTQMHRLFEIQKR